MKIKIKRLTLDNFKCFTHKEITFDNDVTTIMGRNGAGKTTIADAILWCLFGKNSAGQSDFDLKTHDSDGKPIPNLDHSVEMELQINAIEDPKTVIEANIVNVITLKRTLKETWIKKRGSDEQVFKNNTTEYMVNGDSYTAADYKKYITALIDENVFKAITNPSYFPSLKWQEQRVFLSNIAGTIEPEAIADTDELVELVHYLDNSNDDIITYRKHISYQIKQIKDKLDKIPVRLEEQHKALPEKLDWDAVTELSDKAKSELAEIEQKILKVKSGGGDEVEQERIRNEIKQVQSKLDLMEGMVRSKVRELQSDKDEKIAEASRKFGQLVTTQRDLESQLQSFDTLKKRCQETLDECEKEAEKIREEWAHNLSRTFHFHENDGICPNCGQYYPAERIAEIRQKAEENLNADKARIKTELTQKAEKVKITRAEAEKAIADYDQKKAEAEKNLTNIKDEINIAFSEKAKIDKQSVPTVEEILNGDDDYRSTASQLASLKASLESASTSKVDDGVLTELEAEKGRISAEMANYQTQLASQIQYDKIQTLIDGINEEKRELVRQLSELERKEDVARKYQDRQNTILEERINQHFSLVKWKMFRTVNNGGDPFDEPYCECYVDGVAYHDGLNQAARLNAGLDILNTLCKHYNVSAPIVIDNAEAVNKILPTTGQQIRLYVSEDEHLTIV